MLAFSYLHQKKIINCIKNQLMKEKTKTKSTMRKQVQFFLMLLFSLFFAGGVYAQQVTITPSSTDLCFGDQLSVEVNLTGGTGTEAKMDWDNDGSFDATLSYTGTTYSFQTIYPTTGPKTMKVVVTLQGGGTVNSTQNVIVYKLPNPSAVVTGSPIQCFRGNFVTLTNHSSKTDNDIARIEIDWGDARIDLFPFPTPGQVYSHSYNAASLYTVSLKVIDTKGCFKDTVYTGMITIKQNISPEFLVVGQRNCDTSQYLFINQTVGVPFNMLKSYTWDFGDGSIDKRQKPWNMPTDSIHYDTIFHNFTKNGIFEPALIIEDSTGCIDSIRIDKNSSKNKPENIVIRFDATPYLTPDDTIKRDSVCFGKEGFKTLFFRQTPNELISSGDPNRFLWNFDDPPSQQLNFNSTLWALSHDFQKGLGPYNVKFLIWPPGTGTKCRKDTTIRVEVIGPKAQIEDPPNMILLDPTQKNQCQANPSGYYNTVQFVNTNQYYKSEHVFRLWDFGDDFAPQCTSYLVPNVGYPPMGGWSTAQDQYNYSHGYWRQGGKVFPGKRLDCRYSADTLPMHNYRDWDKIYQWYRYGHDFMPWDPAPTGQYTRNPADTLIPVAMGGKIWVQDWDTLYWNKPVYLNPTTGEWSLTQGTYNDPLLGNVPWPRIDTIPSLDANGQPSPQDLQPYNRFTLNNGAPDPLVGFWGNTLPTDGNYGFVPRGTVIDPKNQNMQLLYLASNGTPYIHHYDSTFEESTNHRITFYRYMFNRGVIKCHTVKQFLKDSLNNVGNKSFIIPNDITVLDSLDCEHEANVQLKLMKPDARGVGKRGVECPGPYSGPDNAGIQFMFGPVSDRLGDYPGISPDCGQSFIRFCHDSMADRMDNTPCVLDGFVDFAGGTTAGGLTLPPFANQPDFAQFNPMLLWQKPDGTSFWYQYGPGVASGWPLSVPANPTGDVTIGIIIGTGDPTNPCMSDTVWYHNFLNFTDLDGRFFLDPTYDQITNAPTNGVCKLYCKNDEVNFVYIDSTQRNVWSSTIDWGDNSVTVDSFYWGKPGQNDGYYVNGFRRVRYQIYYGPCGEDILGTVYDSTVFPNGVPGVVVDTLYFDNYTNRIYDPVTNPNGSLIRIGANNAGDSVQWQECGKFFWVANSDTLKTFYLMDIRDKAKMLLPVKHKYWSSSFEDDCRRAGSAPRPVTHTLISTKTCKKYNVDNKLLVRGVIDSVRTRNAKGEWDNIFCKDEPVFFYDSIRYYRPDCSLSDPIFNPNFNPKDGTPYNSPFNAYHFDTIDYWRDGTLDQNEYWPDGSFIEKVKYYFGDGDSAMITRPVHRYKNPGKYTVMLLSRARNGCWDTTTCVVYISEVKSIPVIKPGTYNCGAKVTFYDKSTMTPLPGFSGNPFDSVRFEPQPGTLINNNFWWFGERTTADTALRADAYAIDTAQWNYRKNGTFRVKLVVETAQGCKDTGFTELYISGPRPKIKIISDTVGCAPFTVKVVNLADVEGGKDANDKPTLRTDILWGDGNNQFTKSLAQYDTLTFTYPDSGTFYIFARGDDNDPQSDINGCRIVYYPDTVDGNDAPLKIRVMRSYPVSVSVDPQTVCVDQQFYIHNASDTISYTEFKYSLMSGDYSTLIDTIIKSNVDNHYTRTLPDTGTYQVLLNPTAVAPGLPDCRLADTATIKVVRPYASFTIDSAERNPKFHFNNTSMSASEYTWSAYKLENGTLNLVKTEDKVEADRDWNYDFDKDTGDVVICLEAFTADPAKPICVDKVCDTISYRFVIEFEIYNVFTPDKSGANDVFDIKIKGHTEYDLVIYNRWGNKVFESTDSEKDWDGTNMNDGTDCPAGTYYYVFKYEMLNGEKKTLNGTVTLIRP